MRTQSMRFISILALSVWASATPALANAPELESRVKESKVVLDEIMKSPDQSIPEEMLAKAHAIAIYPNVVKGGFIVGARFGKGVVVAKKPDGTWGAPAFSTIGGGSWGLQVGGQLTDLIFVVMNERGLQGLLANSFTLGADASVAAGPVGRQSEAMTDLSLRAPIFSYSRSRGLFGGVALDGAVVTQDNNSNSLYYGKDVTSRDILLDHDTEVPPSAKELVDALTEYSKRWKEGTAAPQAA